VALFCCGLSVVQPKAALRWNCGYTVIRFPITFWWRTNLSPLKKASPAEQHGTDPRSRVVDGTSPGHRTPFARNLIGTAY
jgi:hypothetical protein